MESEMMIIMDCTHEIEPYQCKVCNLETKFLVSFKQHLKNGCQYETPDEMVYKCLRCHFLTSSNFLIIRHSLSNKCLTTDDERKIPYLCCKVDQLENSKFDDENAAKLSHLTSYFNKWKDSLKCDYCCVKFTCKGSLTRHMKFQHSKSSGIKCDLCSLKCETKSDLNNHNCLSYDENIQRFKCGHCPRKFKLKGQLKIHIKCQHTDSNDIQWFQCAQCPSKFKLKPNLKSHMIYRHTKPEDLEWFECEVCPSKFKTKADLKTHNKFRHTEDEHVQWFQCEQCSYKSKRKKDLNSHVTSCHSNPGDGVQCEFCPLKFKLKSYLKKHVKFVHSKPEDIRWFECAVCSFKCKSTTGLKSHVKHRHTKGEGLESVKCEVTL